jgi:hypothetical protein
MLILFFLCGASAASHPVLLQAAQGGGLMVRGAVVQQDGKVYYQLSFTNQSQQALGGIAIQVPIEPKSERALRTGYSGIVCHALKHLQLRGTFAVRDIPNT